MSMPDESGPGAQPTDLPRTICIDPDCYEWTVATAATCPVHLAESMQRSGEVLVFAGSPFAAFEATAHHLNRTIPGRYSSQGTPGNPSSSSSFWLLRSTPIS